MEKHENMACQRNKSIIGLQWSPVSKMSEKESMKEGSYRFSKKQIREIFEIETVKDTVYQRTLDHCQRHYLL